MILKFHFRGQRTNRLPKWVRILFKIQLLDFTKINYEKPNFFNEFDSSKLKDEIIKQLLDGGEDQELLEIKAYNDEIYNEKLLGLIEL